MISRLDKWIIAKSYPKLSKSESNPESGFEDGSKDVFADALAYGLYAPLIVHPGWISEVTVDLQLKARAYRMAQSLKCVKEKLSTEFDAFIYLYTALSVIPASKYWYNILFHLFKKYFPKHAKALGMEIDELNDYERHLLIKLRRWIYNQQVKHLREIKKIVI